MRSTDVDHRIEAVASVQYGSFSRQQAFEAGATDRFVHRRLAERVWIRVMPGVYALASSPGTWLRQCMVAMLSVPGSSVACRTAAALAELTAFKQGPIELAIPANASTRHSRATLHRFAGALTTEIKGIRTTTIAQTLCDVAGFVSPLKVERAFDDCLLGDRLALDEMLERVDYYAGSRRPGLRVIEALVAERSAEAWEPPESELEVLLYAVLGRLSPAPLIVRQAEFPWRSPRPGRIDTLLPDYRLIVEADGRRWHTRVADFDRDRWRDNEAVANGYRVQRFTWVHLHDMADESLKLLHRTLATLGQDAA